MDALRRTPIGELSGIIEKFVKHKRSLGYKYRLQEELLYRFSVFSLSYEIKKNVIPKELVENWVRHIEGETRRTQQIRGNCMNVFLRFAGDNGYYVVLPSKSKRDRSVYAPYIFTEDEMVRFFHACDHMHRYSGTNKHIMVPVIFRLLYSCGLRVSEVSYLKWQDVDVIRGILIIRNGKLGKDRLVPMSDSLSKVMLQYEGLTNHRDKMFEYVFRSKNLRPISRGWIYRQFRVILRNCKIPHRGKGKGPRLHDLRHSFCVHSLKVMVEKGMDVYCALPILATYVGHASINAIQGYVRLTAEIYPKLIETMSKDSGHLIPEVTQDETN